MKEGELRVLREEAGWSTGVAFWPSAFLNDGHIARGLCDISPVGVQDGSHRPGRSRLDNEV